LENKFKMCRIKEKNKNRVPTITCIPWKPVAKKKLEPKMESLILKEAS